jgi:putative hydroxymethylpyrimidine transport system ATP-binding protein
VQNVTIGARLRGARPDVARARALLAQVGLQGMERRRPDALSGGQRQRVALARVLMEDCPIVVLDEPFSALDTVTRLAMQDMAASVLQGRTVILITHDPLEAIRLSDHAYLLGPLGAESLALPARPTPRDFTAPETLAAQARLLARLHSLGPALCAG